MSAITLLQGNAGSSSSDSTTLKLKLSEAPQHKDVRIYEYTSAANPTMRPVPVLVHPPALHETPGPSRVIPFDNSSFMDISYPATSPNLLAAFLKINPGESLESQATATSQAFYVIRGSGTTTWGQGTEQETLTWSTGDLFVLPACDETVKHSATEDAAIYWVSDQPLLEYLGVKPSVRKFNVTHFTRERMLAEVERISHEPGAEHRNRMGILLGNKITENNTKTLTHTLWSLLNMLPAKDAQRPHRHNSVALDLCVTAASEGVYTMMGPELGADGWVKDPIRCDWKTGGVFTTPPGWWHSHHNETDQPAWVLPMQDAGLHTHFRTLDIRFATAPTVAAMPESTESLKANWSMGTLPVTKTESFTPNPPPGGGLGYFP